MEQLRNQLAGRSIDRTLRPEQLIHLQLEYSQYEVRAEIKFRVDLLR